MHSKKGGNIIAAGVAERRERPALALAAARQRSAHPLRRIGPPARRIAQPRTGRPRSPRCPPSATVDSCCCRLPSTPRVGRQKRPGCVAVLRPPRLLPVGRATSPSSAIHSSKAPDASTRARTPRVKAPLRHQTLAPGTSRSRHPRAPSSQPGCSHSAPSPRSGPRRPPGSPPRAPLACAASSPRCEGVRTRAWRQRAMLQSSRPCRRLPPPPQPVTPRRSRAACPSGRQQPGQHSAPPGALSAISRSHAATRA